MEPVSGVRVHRHEAVAASGAICEIVLDRPAAMNALSTAMAARLAQACAEIAASPQIRAVVLAASGERAFCVGADLKERAAMTDAEFLAQRPVFRAAFGAVHGLPQPVIAAVHGYALSGGRELALSCDLIVADETAMFGLPRMDCPSRSGVVRRGAAHQRKYRVRSQAVRGSLRALAPLTGSPRKPGGRS